MDDFLKEDVYYGKTIGRICGRVIRDNQIILHGGHHGLSNQIFDYVVITAIDTSGNRGKLGAYVQQGKLKKPAIYRTHGGRARAIETGELHINVAFIAAPCCDKYGNINGVQGKSACGSLGYAMPDAEYADFVVAVTDGYTETALDYVSIPQTQVDYP